MRINRLHREQCECKIRNLKMMDDRVNGAQEIFTSDTAGAKLSAYTAVSAYCEALRNFNAAEFLA